MPKNHIEQDLSRERGVQDERMQGDSESSSALRSGVFGDMDEAAYYQMQNLPAVPERPGYRHYWGRLSTHQEDDFSNVQRLYRMGWRPRMLDTVPDGITVPSIKHGEWAGAIVIRDCILMERPVAIHEQHKAALKKRTDQQTRAITGELEKIEQEAMPIDVEIKSRVSRGQGRRPPVKSDALSET